MSKYNRLLPPYNQVQFIEETIRSVLLQGYPNLEYIIMDGGSTDGSVDIIRKYEDHITYWVSEKDDGQSDAINKGWDIASEDICAWLNSDDAYTPGAVRAAVEIFLKSPDAGVVYGDLEMIDHTGNSLGISILRRYNKLWFLSPLCLHYLFFRMWQNFPPALQSYLRSQRRLPRDLVHLEAQRK